MKNALLDPPSFKDNDYMGAHVRPLEPHRSALHFFGAELRHRRIEAGLSLRLLAGRVFAAKTLVASVETGLRFPSLDLAARCDEVLAAGGALVRLHAFAVAGRDDQRHAHRPDGLDPAETVQLRRLLAAINLVTVAQTVPANLSLLDPDR